MWNSGLVVMGDLPRWKEYDEVVSLWWATYPNRKNVKCGLIVMGDLPKWKKMWKTVLLWWATYPDGKNMMNGLIIMGDLPRWKKCAMTSVKNRIYLAKSLRGWQKKGWKTWCFLIIPDHRVWKLSVSWLQRLKTRGFLIARLIFSFLLGFS